MKIHATQQGFTLIEILVAVTIMVMLAVMMSTLFHQSSVAWDGGMRKVEGNVQARSALALMVREISHAVAYTNDLRAAYIRNDKDKVSFFTLSDESTKTRRIAKEITYDLTAGTTIRRQERRLTKDYAGWEGNTNPLVIITNAYRFKFYTADAVTYFGEPPRWLRVELGLSREEDVSAVGARCSGPDGVMNTSDDIKSW